MDVNELQPDTPPDEAAMSLYAAGLIAWRDGEHEIAVGFFRTARDVALVSIATRGVHVL